MTEPTLSTTDRPDEARTAAVRALADAAAAVDGNAPLSEQILLNLRHGAEGVTHLLLEADGEPVGYAQLDDSGGAGAVAELVVHPAHRGRGNGTALVRAALDRSAGRLAVWAHGEHPAAQALADRFGFDRARELWRMRRPLVSNGVLSDGTAPLPQPEFPAGVTVRAFEPGHDEAEFLRVNNAAFDWHPEQGGWDRGQLAQRAAEPWFDPAGFLLAVEGDRAAGSERLLGYHWTKVHPAVGTTPAIGEVYVLGVDPGAQGRGLGRALTLAGLRHLRDTGLDAVMLYVEADNSGAAGLYRDLGFTLSGSDILYRN